MTQAPDRPDLVLFTGWFPYANGEAVLGPELAVIAPRFRRILIVPSEPGGVVVPLPENVSVSDLRWPPRGGTREKLRSLICPDTARVAMSVAALGRTRPCAHN